MEVKQTENKKNAEDNLALGAKGGTIAFVLNISRVSLGFLNTIILARILGASGAGEFFLSISVLNICSLLAGFGVQGAMQRFVPYYIEKDEREKLKGVIFFLLKFCFLLSAIFSVLIILLSNVISINLFHSENLLKLLPITALILPVFVLNDVLRGILKGYKDTFRALFPHLVIAPLLKIIVFLLLSLISVSSMFAVVAVLAGEIIASIFLVKYLLAKLDKAKPLYQRSEYKRVLRVASTMIFTGFSIYIFTEVDLWVVAMYTSSEDVGIYGAVARLVMLIAFSLQAFSAILPPIISSIHTSGDRNELQKVIRESTRWILTISIPIVLIFVLEGKLLLKYAYGEEFVKGYIVLMILTIGQLISAGSGLVGWILQMTGGHKSFMRITVFWGIINVILNFILVPRLGIIGAAISTAFSLSMVRIVSIWVIYKKLSILTLAKGLKFDVIYVLILAGSYILLSYKNFHIGIHLLLIVSLAVYIRRAIINGDLPWRYILARYKTG